jgi:hypothetical protein
MRCSRCDHENPEEALSGAAPAAEASAPERDPRDDTPRHLAERILLGKARVTA